MRLEIDRDNLLIYIQTQQDQAYVLDTLGAEAVFVPAASPFHVDRNENWPLLAEVEFTLGKPRYIRIRKKKDAGDE